MSRKTWHERAETRETRRSCRRCGDPEFRIHGYCSCECESLHEVELERNELREEIDRLSRTITLVWQALFKHGVVADNKTSISEFVDRLGAERDELRECLRLAWASACAAEQVLISAAALARIRKALEEA